MMRYWIYLNNEVVGPYTVEELTQIETFNLNSQVCAEGSDIWQYAYTVPEIASQYEDVTATFHTAEDEEPAQTETFNITQPSPYEDEDNFQEPLNLKEVSFEEISETKRAAAAPAQAQNTIDLSKSGIHIVTAPPLINIKPIEEIQDMQLKAEQAQEQQAAQENKTAEEFPAQQPVQEFTVEQEEQPAQQPQPEQPAEVNLSQPESQAIEHQMQEAAAQAQETASEEQAQPGQPAEVNLSQPEQEPAFTTTNEEQPAQENITAEEFRAQQPVQEFTAEQEEQPAQQPQPEQPAEVNLSQPESHIIEHQMQEAAAQAQETASEEQAQPGQSAEIDLSQPEQEPAVTTTNEEQPAQENITAEESPAQQPAQEFSAEQEDQPAEQLQPEQPAEVNLSQPEPAAEQIQEEQPAETQAGQEAAVEQTEEQPAQEIKTEDIEQPAENNGEASVEIKPSSINFSAHPLDSGIRKPEDSASEIKEVNLSSQPEAEVKEPQEEQKQEQSEPVEIKPSSINFSARPFDSGIRQPADKQPFEPKEIDLSGRSEAAQLPEEKPVAEEPGQSTEQHEIKTEEAKQPTEDLSLQEQEVAGPEEPVKEEQPEPAQPEQKPAETEQEEPAVAAQPQEEQSAQEAQPAPSNEETEVHVETNIPLDVQLKDIPVIEVPDIEETIDSYLETIDGEALAQIEERILNYKQINLKELLESKVNEAIQNIAATSAAPQTSVNTTKEEIISKMDSIMQELAKVHTEIQEMSENFNQKVEVTSAAIAALKNKSFKAPAETASKSSGFTPAALPTKRIEPKQDTTPAKTFTPKPIPIEQEMAILDKKDPAEIRETEDLDANEYTMDYMKMTLPESEPLKVEERKEEPAKPEPSAPKTDALADIYKEALKPTMRTAAAQPAAVPMPAGPNDITPSERSRKVKPIESLLTPLIDTPSGNAPKSTSTATSAPSSLSASYTPAMPNNNPSGTTRIMPMVDDMDSDNSGGFRFAAPLEDPTEAPTVQEPEGHGEELTIFQGEGYKSGAQGTDKTKIIIIAVIALVIAGGIFAAYSMGYFDKLLGKKPAVQQTENNSMNTRIKNEISRFPIAAMNDDSLSAALTKLYPDATLKSDADWIIQPNPDGETYQSTIKLSNNEGGGAVTLIFSYSLKTGELTGVNTPAIEALAGNAVQTGFENMPGTEEKQSPVDAEPVQQQEEAPEPQQQQPPRRTPRR